MNDKTKTKRMAKTIRTRHDAMAFAADVISFMSQLYDSVQSDEATVAVSIKVEPGENESSILFDDTE